MAISSVAVLVMFFVFAVTGQPTTAANRGWADFQSRYIEDGRCAYTFILPDKEQQSCGKDYDDALQTVTDRVTTLETQQPPNLDATLQSLLETQETLLGRVAELETQQMLNQPPPTYPTEIPLPDPHEQRVAFSVVRTTSLGPVSSDTVIVYDKVYSNDGNGYNTSTGKFTCPVSGMYYFMISALRQSSSYHLHVCLIKNTTKLPCIYAHNSGGRSHGAASNSVIIDIDHGDEIWVRLVSGYAVYSDIYEYTTFTGYLLYSITQ
ncbi:caprin-2-like [Glandiceps talaboti]